MNRPTAKRLGCVECATCEGTGMVGPFILDFGSFAVKVCKECPSCKGHQFVRVGS